MSHCAGLFWGLQLGGGGCSPVRPRVDHRKGKGSQDKFPANCLQRRSGGVREVPYVNVRIPPGLLCMLQPGLTSSCLHYTIAVDIMHPVNPATLSKLVIMVFTCPRTVKMDTESYHSLCRTAT